MRWPWATGGALRGQKPPPAEMQPAPLVPSTSRDSRDSSIAIEDTKRSSSPASGTSDAPIRPTLVVSPPSRCSSPSYSEHSTLSYTRLVFPASCPTSPSKTAFTTSPPRDSAPDPQPRRRMSTLLDQAARKATTITARSALEVLPQSRRPRTAPGTHRNEIGWNGEWGTGGPGEVQSMEDVVRSLRRLKIK